MKKYPLPLFLIIVLSIMILFTSCDPKIEQDICTITFDDNGVEGVKIPDKMELVKGSSFTLHSCSVVTDKGYDFVYWSTTPDGAGKKFFSYSTYEAENSLSLYAQWVPHKYNIFYDYNGGSLQPDSINPSYYSIETESFTLSKPVREEYDFLGWKLIEEKNDSEAKKEYLIKQGTYGDLSFVAVWKLLNSYIISYDSNGANGYVSTENKLENKSVIIADGFELTKEGYSFAGWNTQTDGLGTSYKPGERYTTNADIKLYAQWQAVPYTVLYDLDGGIFQEDISNPKEYTIETDTFKLQSPSKEGYTFLGWKIAEAEDSTAMKDFSIKKGSIGNLSLKAVWRPLNSYSIVYIANGADGSEDTAFKQEDKEITIASADKLTRRGYTFDSWNTQENGKGRTYKAGEEYTMNANLKLYAQWQAIPYTISYDLKGGVLQTGISNPSKYTVETDTFILENPRKGDYEFFGWKIKNHDSSQAKTEYTIEKGSIGDLSLEAVWSASPKITVTFDSNGEDGSVPNPITAYLGESFTIPIGDNFIKDGYLFKEWNTERDGSGTAYRENTTVVATKHLILYAILEKTPLVFSYMANTDSYSVKCTDANITSCVVPARYKGKPVTTLDDYAFCSCTSLKSITLPDSLTAINVFAFYKCTALRSITIPDSVISLGNSVFWECTSLESIILPSCLTGISAGTFYKCTSIQSIIIPDSVTSIGNNAFSYCESLRTITFPEGITSIGLLAFDSCNSLQSVTLPDGLTTIGNYAFRGCAAIQSITIPEGVTTIGSGEFQNCSNLSFVNLPNGITSIGSNAFAGCNSLKSIAIPEGVTSINDGVFQNCTSLTYLSLPSTITAISNSAFKGCKNLSIKLSEGITTIPEEALKGAVGVISITLPSTINTIGKNAFEGCENLSVIFAEGITTIPANALSNAKGVISVTIPSTVKNIGDYAFFNCTSLKSITLHEGLNTIGSRAFYSCTSLRFINIPDGLITIGDYAFYSCTSLQSVTLPEGLTSIGSATFSGCNALQSINLPEGITSIKQEVFSKCSALETLTLPSSVTSIDYGAFDKCTSLTSIILPNGLKSIGNFAFSSCVSLESIALPDGLKTIGEKAFSSCLSLESATIPEGLTFIGDYAFRDCTAIQSITIPEDVTTIGFGEFQNCSNLSFISLPEGITSIGSNAFAGCRSLKSIIYQGTKAQWEAIEKGDLWDYSTNNYIIHFKDGDSPKEV